MIQKEESHEQRQHLGGRIAGQVAGNPGSIVQGTGFQRTVVQLERTSPCQGEVVVGGKDGVVVPIGGGNSSSGEVPETGCDQDHGGDSGPGAWLEQYRTSSVHGCRPSGHGGLSQGRREDQVDPRDSGFHQSQPSGCQGRGGAELSQGFGIRNHPSLHSDLEALLALRWAEFNLYYPKKHMKPSGEQGVPDFLKARLDHIREGGTPWWRGYPGEEFPVMISQEFFQGGGGKASSPVNDHVCILCKNHRCSKMEKSCWKCGHPIS